jgi:hypothetical protein
VGGPPPEGAEGGQRLSPKTSSTISPVWLIRQCRLFRPGGLGWATFLLSSQIAVSSSQFLSGSVSGSESVSFPHPAGLSGLDTDPDCDADTEGRPRGTPRSRRSRIQVREPVLIEGRAASRGEGWRRRVGAPGQFPEFEDFSFKFEAGLRGRSQLPVARSDLCSRKDAKTQRGTNRCCLLLALVVLASLRLERSGREHSIRHHKQERAVHRKRRGWERRCRGLRGLA